jgi:hypothetical protein
MKAVYFQTQVHRRREMTMKHISAQWITLAAIGGLWGGSLLADPAAAQTANSPYTLSVFA